MGGVPRGIAAAVPVMVSDLGAAFARAGPIAARVVRCVSGKIGCAVSHRAGQNVMLVALVITPHHAIAVLVQGGSQDDIGIQMELIEIAGDQFPLWIVPGANSDPGARGDTTLSFSLGAEVGAPGAPGGSASHRQLRAMSVGAFQTAQVSALSHTDTGNKESHCMILRRRERRAHQK